VGAAASLYHFVQDLKDSLLLISKTNTIIDAPSNYTRSKENKSKAMWYISIVYSVHNWNQILSDWKCFALDNPAYTTPRLYLYWELKWPWQTTLGSMSIT
jgi:hypothetical protein